MHCLFCRMIHQDSPVTKVFEDDDFIGIRDIAPQAPIHVLLIPKKHITSINTLEASDRLLLGQMMLNAQQIAQDQGISHEGFRLVFNTNQHGGQTVNHLHLHILGGRALSWPPG